MSCWCALFQLSVIMEERDQLKRIVEDLKRRYDDDKGHANYSVDNIQVETAIFILDQYALTCAKYLC